MAPPPQGVLYGDARGGRGSIDEAAFQAHVAGRVDIRIAGAQKVIDANASARIAVDADRTDSVRDIRRLPRAGEMASTPIVLR
jgi:hypothetical protein